MFKLFQRFLWKESDQDFAEYALILGPIGYLAHRHQRSAIDR
jgi:Flp pilus assembly pilin Flp